MFSKNNIAILCASLVWASVVFIIIFSFSYIPGTDPDSFYHIRMAEIMASQGLIVKKFLWTTCSIWNVNYFDKDWLFHVYLVPFVKYFNCIPAVKYALCILVFLCASSWGILARELRIRYIFLTLMLIGFITCTGFIDRLTLFRAHVLSIMIFPLCILCMLRGWRVALMIICILYTLGYTGSWQVAGVAFVYDIIKSLMEKRIRAIESSTLWSACGIIIGSVINPYFPYNLYGGFIQNIMVLKSSIFGMSDYKIIQGMELWPIGLITLITFFAPIIILHAVSLIWFANKYRSFKSTNLVFIGIISVVYFVLTITVVKFTDYYVPLAVTFVMLFFEKIHYRIRPLIKNTAIALLSVLMLCVSIVSIRMIIRSTMDRVTYKDSCEWLNRNVRTEGTPMSPVKTVFTAGWDDSPYLFYGCPQFKYLVMLDPYFMYDYSKTKYRLWQKISDGKTFDPAYLIKKEFGTDIVFVSQFKPALQKQLDESPYVELKYVGKYFEKIYFIKNIPGNEHRR